VYNADGSSTATLKDINGGHLWVTWQFDKQGQLISKTANTP
jgi:hypothetical protein